MKLSVIIPALNESQYLPAAVESLRREAMSGAPHEIIVADCGSVDKTPGIARELGVSLIMDSTLNSRARALNMGASQASGDVLLFLDADTSVPNGYDEAIRIVLENEGVVGGAFEFALDGPGFGLRLIEFLNRIRYRVRHRFYGDQGIFVRADVFFDVEGYPDRRIMEASCFCALLQQMGRLTLIRKYMKTSPRRFLEGGIYRVLANDIRIWLLDLLGRPTEHFADAYQDDNHRRGRRAAAGGKASSSL